MNDEDLLLTRDPDRLLRMLGRVQPPTGIHERALDRLQAARQGLAVQERVSQRRWLLIATAACTLTALGLNGWLHSRTWHGSPNGFPVQPGHVHAVGAVSEASHTPQHIPLEEAQASALPRVPGVRFAMATTKAPKQRHSAAEVSAWVSIPAPPAPLTEQEKVLLRWAQQGGVLLSRGEKQPPEQASSKPPGEPLPAFPTSVTPGDRLPPFNVAAVPTHALPPFPQANPFGDPQ